MAYNYRYENSKEDGFGGQEMTDIPNIRSRINYAKAKTMNDSRSNSPPKYTNGLNSEMLASDVVKLNEQKVRDNIIFANNSGSIGPYLKFDKTSPSPKVPKLGPPTSSYKNHYSPERSHEPIKMSLNESLDYNRSYNNLSMGIRHISNGDAMYRRGALSKSIDFGPPSKTCFKYARDANLDKPDEFRFKKNLTSNADRILNKSMVPSYPSTNEPARMGSLKKEVSTCPASPKIQTKPYSPGPPKNSFTREPQFSTGQNEIKPQSPNNIVKPVSPAPNQSYPSGDFESAQNKKPTSISPADSANYTPSLNAQIPETVPKFQPDRSEPSFNDPSYHRRKNFNNYGFNAITGVRKEAAFREL
ncbi:unnamed protein product [Moneuplotes crassus]|uniref:Uncharacterized protein n=2 Tax=Euplotes crassus TaxID=5936 RepID=A0AAD1XCP1_EUPCR|nr:unnamed protein product [Moneuplotes crassus]